MSGCLAKLLKISEQYSFLKPVFHGNFVSYFKYGPFGELLCNNVYNEWISSNVLCRDIPVFPFYSGSSNSGGFLEGIKEHYVEAKTICKQNLPFSISYSRISKDSGGSSVYDTEEQKYFRPKKRTELKCVTFTTPDEGQPFFHFWQRQRKVWWRKFSADPGKFSLTEIKNDAANNTEFVDIQVKFPWGVECVETICFFPEQTFDSVSEQDRELWKYKTNKKNKAIFPNIIESTMNLETAVFCFLCDAFIEEIRLDNDLPRQFIKLHRKLAPYKAAFVMDTKGTGSQKEDMRLLTEYLALNLKKNGISTFFIPQPEYKSVEELFQYYDLIGVPYVVVVKASTLSDGIFGLRSRETTLQEQLHIDQLTHYMEMLLKNY